MTKGILVGAAGTLLVLLLGGFAVVQLGLLPANADAKPPALEKWVARRSLRAAVRREAPSGAGPVAVNDESLTAGVKLYARHCAVCHGAADGEASAIAKGLYQRAPQLAKHGVDDDPEGETYWKVAHGIRMTGMPSFKGTLSEEQLWQLTLFVKHMPGLTPGAKAAWQAVPSAAPQTN